MSHKIVRIPTRDSEFDKYQQTVNDHLNASSAGGIPGVPAPVVSPLPNWERLGMTRRELDTLNTFNKEWNAVYLLTKDRSTRTAALTEQKNELRVAYEAFLRPLLGRIERHPALTADDRQTLRLFVRDTELTRRAKITVAPYVKLAALEGGFIKVRVRIDEDATRSNMHHLADGVEVKFNIGGSQPASAKDCTSSHVSKQSIFVLEVGEEHAGKRLYCFLRWVNLSEPGKSGPFSKLMSTVIVD